MTPERWQRLKALFAGALDEPAGDGPRAPVPGDVDADLASDLKVLLEEHANAGGFLEDPAEALVWGERKQVGPYVLVREIGRGGMGTVFLARREDGTFDRTVALKVVRRGLDTEDVLARFRDERQILASLQHPNIATLYDGGSTDDGRPYFAMEHVEGEPIDRYCARRSLPVEKRLSLFVEVCRAVQYAHDRHVIHRDLKPENILVTAEGIPKLLDFGIAKVLEPLTGSSPEGTRFTAVTQGILTPAYASPEQLRKQPTTTATDVYSLGVLLFLLLTGRHPFDDGRRSGEEVRQAALDLDAPRPSGLAPSLSRDLDAITLQALEKDPGRRYASVADLASDVSRFLEGVSPAARRHGALRLVRRLVNRHRTRAAFAAAFLVVAAAAVPWLRRGAGVTAPSSAPAFVKPRRTVAVLGFRNLSGEPRSAWLSTALSEMLATELAAGGRLRTVPGEAVARMQADLSLPVAEELASPTLLRVRQHVAADDVVVGSYAVVGSGAAERIRLDARLQDTARGVTLASVAETGSSADLFSLVSAAGRRLRKELGVAADLSEEESRAARAASPGSPEAARLYAEGLVKMRTFDVLAAKDLFEKAAEREPESALIRMAIADAWMALGHDRKARDAAEQALARAGGLSRPDTLAVEGRAAEARKDWPKAIETYGALFRFFPDDLSHGLKLAAAETSGGKAREALATVDELRRLPPPSGRDPRIDLAAAAAASQLGDQNGALDAARKALEKATALGAPMFVARARNREAAECSRLGRPEESLVAAEAALAISKEIGDPFGSSIALNEKAVALWDKGDLAGAETALRTSLDLATRAGNEKTAAACLGNLAGLRVERDDAKGARELYLRCLDVAKGIGDNDKAASALMSLANVETILVDDATALRHLSEATAIHREAGNKRGTGYCLEQIGSVQTDMGDLEGARRSLEESAALLREVKNERVLSKTLLELGEVEKWRGDLAAARGLYEQSLGLATKTNDEMQILRCRRRLLLQLLHEKRFKEAEAFATELAASFQKKGMPADREECVALAALSLLRQGRVDEAQKTISTLNRREGKAPPPGWSSSGAIAEAVVGARGGDAENAIARLRDLAADGRRRGDRVGEWRALLALAEVEIGLGRLQEARKRLAALEEETRARGYELLAREARELLKSAPLQLPKPL